MKFIVSLFFLKFKNILSKLYLKHSRYSLPVLESYTLEKIIRAQNSPIHPCVGIYRDLNGKKVKVKSFQYKIKNYRYYQLLKEFTLLTYFHQNLKTGTISMPESYAIHDRKERLTVISEFVSGEDLRAHPYKNQLETVKTVLKELENIKIDEKLKNVLVTHSKLYLISSFLVYWLVSFLKDFKNISKNFQMGIFFYRNYLSSISSRKDEYVFSHRDLYFDHIIVSGKKIYLIDPELAVITEKYTDLAIFTKKAYSEIGDKIKELIEDFCIDNLKYRKFLTLSIYYCVQAIAVMPADHKDSFIAKNYIANFLLREIVK